MIEKPIPFSAPMVRAILAGAKTQTRRTCKGTFSDGKPCPYGAPGTKLWVREAWRSGKLTDRFPPREMTPHVVWYEADGAAPEATSGKLRPGMFMPRWASRITLEVTGVRVERLQDISEADARAEGVSFVGDGCARFGVEGLASSWCDCPVTAYAALWESINGNGSWAANPWLWIIEFKRIAPSGGAAI